MSELKRMFRENFWDDPQTIQAAKSLALMAGLYQAGSWLKHRREAQSPVNVLGIINSHRNVPRVNKKPLSAENVNKRFGRPINKRGEAKKTLREELGEIEAWKNRKMTEERANKIIEDWRKSKGYTTPPKDTSSFRPYEKFGKAGQEEDKRKTSASKQAAKDDLKNLVTDKQIPHKLPSRFWTPKRIAGTVAIAALIGGLHARQRHMQRQVRAFRGDLATQAGITPRQEWITRSR